MKWVVFSGPTITSAEVQRETDGAAIARGPVSCGDVFRAHEEGAQAILIIDGYFEHRLAVWHKEILWALSRGVRMVGASSLGALRAVELEAYGMLGVGQVFEWFRDGTLEDEDEVTIIHQSAEHGYRPVSDALVNIRATLASAVENGKLDAASAASLIAIAKRQFYPSRSLRSLLAIGADTGLVADRDALARWIETGMVDQKRLDALAALRRLREEIEGATSTPVKPQFHFEYTEAWHELVQLLRRTQRSQ